MCFYFILFYFILAHSLPVGAQAPFQTIQYSFYFTSKENLAVSRGIFKFHKHFMCMGVKWNCLLEASEGYGEVGG